MTFPLRVFGDSHLDQNPLRFDLGTQDSPVRNGFTKVHELTEYSAETGFGFDEAREGESRDQGDDLRADFILTNPHTFTVELENGLYEVEIITGSNWDTNSTTYRFFNEEEDRGGVETSGGEFERYVDTVEVTEEYLDITFGGVWGRVNGLIITAEGEEEPTWQFDFGTESSRVEEGFTKVPNVLIYEESDLSYGFNRLDNATPGSRDQSFAIDRRDFVLASGNTFRADVENGDYLVRIGTGSQFDNDRSSYSILGGDVQGGERTEAGEFNTYEDYIFVEDGQIDIAFSNEWARVNTIEIIPILRVGGLEVTGSSASEGYVDLEWNASDFATSYTVYRQEEGESGLSQIATTEDASYRDETVNAGYTYTYTVAANTDTNLESIQSEPVSVTMVDEDVEAPSRPENIELGNVVPEESVELNWEAREEASLYYVFRSRFAMDQFPHALESYERVAITEDNTFVDTDIHSPNPYYYFVQAVNEGGSSERSDVVEAQPRNLTSPDYLNTEVFDVEVVNTNGTWQALDADGNVLYEDADVVAAVDAAFENLTEGRTEQETVVLRDDATMRFDQYIDVPSHTIFHSEGTIHVEDSNEEFDYNNFAAAVRVMHRENVSIPQLNVTGSPNYGIFIRTSENIFLGQIDLRLSGGHGVRIESRDDDSVYGVRDVVVDNIYVSGTDSHGVETYGVDGITIGTVTAVDTGYSGVLLNDTINANIDMVYGYNAGAGTGYAAFRMANRNGHINDDYDTNIYVGEVIARLGGRGIFSVSRSGGAEIDRIDLAHTGNNLILLENGYNITINGGIAEGASGIRLAARSEFENSWGILMQNLTLRNSSLLEQPRGEDIRFRNITLENSTADVADITFAEDEDEPGDEEPGEDESTHPRDSAPGRQKGEDHPSNTAPGRQKDEDHPSNSAPGRQKDEDNPSNNAPGQQKGEDHPSNRAPGRNNR